MNPANVSNTTRNLILIFLIGLVFHHARSEVVIMPTSSSPMSKIHSSSFGWGPQTFNVTGELYALPRAASCGPSINDIGNLTGKVAIAMGYSGCSYETITRRIQQKGAAAAIIMGKFIALPGIEAYLIDGTDTSDITIPTTSVSVVVFLGILNNAATASKSNETLILQVTDGVNTFDNLFSSVPVAILHQLLFGTVSLMLVLVGIAKFCALKKARKGRSFVSKLPDTCMTLEIVANLIRFIYLGFNPMHGAQKAFPWAFTKMCMASQFLFDSLSTLCLGLHLMQTVDKMNAGNKPAEPMVLLRQVFVSVLAFIVISAYIVDVILDATYEASYITLYAALTYLGVWAVLALWFLAIRLQTSRRLKRLPAGLSGSAPAVRVSKLGVVVSLFMGIKVTSFLILIFAGTTSTTAYFWVFFTFELAILCSSYWTMSMLSSHSLRDAFVAIMGRTSLNGAKKDRVTVTDLATSATSAPSAVVPTNSSMDTDNDAAVPQTYGGSSVVGALQNVI